MKPVLATSKVAAVLLLVVTVLLAATSTSLATTGKDNQHDRVKSFCGPAAPPGWTRAEFESASLTATDEWERAPDYQGGARPSSNKSQLERGGGVLPGMNPAGNGKHKLQVYASWKETATGGDIEIGYTFAWLAYDPAGEKDGTWTGNFPSYETKICADSAAGWQTCMKGKVVDLDGFPTVQGTIIFRVRVIASDANVYIDRVGARRRAP